jgi:hypothetical protein
MRCPVSTEIHNPKLDERAASNVEKDPGDWVSRDDPMTGAQASYLTTLSEQARVERPRDDLSKQMPAKRSTNSKPIFSSES